MAPTFFPNLDRGYCQSGKHGHFLAPCCTVSYCRSKILKNLLDEAQSDDKLTLHQYKEIADAHLTKSEGCAGIGSGALAVKGATTVLMQALLAGLLLAWLLVDP